MSDWLKYEEFVPYLPDDMDVVRINHLSDTCTGSSSSLSIKRESNGTILAYCHRCGKRGAFSKGTVGYAKRKRTEGESEYPDSSSTGGRYPSGKERYRDVPADTTFDTASFPPAGIAWLRKYLDRESIRDRAIGYSPSLRRLILPLYSTISGELILFQTRKVYDEDDGPKYLTYHVAPRGTVYDTLSPYKRDNTAVLVEDLLSAIKVSNAGFNAFPVLGTSISDSQLEQLLLSYQYFYIWFDNDNRIVREKQRVLKNRLDILGNCAILIRTDLDPKEYTTDEIQEILK